MIFPGPQRSASNLAAWRAFWSPQRVARISAAVQTIGEDLGFAPEAFRPFVQHLQGLPDASESGRPDIPERFFGLVGIRAPSSMGTVRNGEDRWRLFVSVTPGAADAAPEFSSAYRQSGVRVFAPTLYATHLGNLLGHTFGRMILIIGISVGVLMLVFYRSWKLTIISLLPVVFSFVCTLGTLNLAGHPLDLAALMLSIIVIGMGVDYCLFIVRSYQLYGSGADPRVGLIRVTVFLAAVSTLVGFGSMGFARHLLLRSAGFTCFFGILYVYAGAVLLLPPLLDRGTSPPTTGRGLLRMWYFNTPKIKPPDPGRDGET